jgi:hypothetical protein
MKFGDVHKIITYHWTSPSEIIFLLFRRQAFCALRLPHASRHPQQRAFFGACRGSLFGNRPGGFFPGTTGSRPSGSPAAGLFCCAGTAAGVLEKPNFFLQSLCIGSRGDIHHFQNILHHFFRILFQFSLCTIITFFHEIRARACFFAFLVFAQLQLIAKQKSKSVP